MSYRKFFEVEEAVDEEEVKGGPNYFLEMVWDAPKVDMSIVTDTSLFNDLVEEMDSNSFCYDLKRWDLDPVKITDGELTEIEYETFNKFIDYHVKRDMTIVEILCLLVECSKIDFEDIDYSKLTLSINEKNMDLLRLEKAVRDGNQQEIENTATMFFR